MKVEINTKEKKFEPIEVKIVIESMDELITFTSMMNVPCSKIKENIPNELKNGAFKINGFLLWDKLGRKLRDISVGLTLNK